MPFKPFVRATAAVVAFAAAAGAASGAVIGLDFEGLPNNSTIGNFYNGGGGINYGIAFTTATQVSVDLDAGGTGNFANEPSPNTVMFFLGANPIVNVAAGFDTGFSFFYSSAAGATVSVYDGLNGTGSVLGSLTVTQQFNGNNCVGDPRGAFCNFTPVGVAFSGIARSINFGGSTNRTAFDNVTFGSITPIPEPATLALLGAGLVGISALRRRFRG